MRKDVTVHESGAMQQQGGGEPPFSIANAVRGNNQFEMEEEQGLPWDRYFAALWRFKFLIVGLLVLGYFGARQVAGSIPPVYSVEAGVFVRNVQTQGGVREVSGDGGMTSNAWVSLLLSPPVRDSVVRKLRLHVRYKNPGDSLIFAEFGTGPEFRTGAYLIKVDSTGNYILSDRKENVFETGAVGDSIGRELGFLWAPAGMSRGWSAQFDIVTLRDASDALTEKLGVQLPEQGGIMKIGLQGENPRLIAATVNQILTEFLSYADTLAKAQSVRLAETLREQLAFADSLYKAAEDTVLNFRIKFALVPRQNLSVPGGTEATTGSAISSFYQRRAQLNDLNEQLAFVDSVQPKVERRELGPSNLLFPASAARHGADLTRAISSYQIAQDDLEQTLRSFSIDNPLALQKKDVVDNIFEGQVLPAARTMREQLMFEAKLLGEQVRKESTEMLDIPPTIIQERILEADAAIKRNNFDMLSTRYTQAQMARANAIPDLSRAYDAEAPVLSNSDASIRVFWMIVGGSLIVAIALVLLLDRLDRRFRYPDQATRELGLTVLGAIPKIRKIKTWQNDPGIAASVVEAFRTVRLALGNAFPTGEPITVAISSPGAGDGKSLVAANLALALAEGGYRCLLIDGDTRRGEMHSTFEVERRPGLLDHLAGKAELSQIVKRTSHQNLWLMPSGTRFKRGPELLMTPAAQPMMEELKARFDAVIIDTPPMGAGVDAYVLSTAVNNMIVVLRAGKSDRKLAAAKLDLLDRLPVRVIGTVLNGVNGQKSYQYYKYISGYQAEPEEEELTPLERSAPTLQLPKK